MKEIERIEKEKRKVKNWERAKEEDRKNVREEA
jgi:hypothetical protein